MNKCKYLHDNWCHNPKIKQLKNRKCIDSENFFCPNYEEDETKNTT